MEIILLWIGGALVFGLLGLALGSGKGNSLAGLFWGALLGPIGLVIVALLSPNEQALIQSGQKRKCVRCGELIQPDALICRFCGLQYTKVNPPQ